MYLLIFVVIGFFLLVLLVPTLLIQRSKVKKARQILINKGWAVQDKPLNIKFPIFDRSRPARLRGVRVKLSSISPDGAMQQELSEYGWLLLAKYWPTVCVLKTTVNTTVPRLVFMYSANYMKPTASDPDVSPVPGIDDPNFFVFSSSHSVNDAATATLAKRLLAIIGDNQVNVEFADGELYVLCYGYLESEDVFDSLQKLTTDLRDAIR